jgi:hypothetical protein
MPVPPSIDNYTVPGGVKLIFDDGTGERDLGNITDLDIETGTEELEHFSNRSGKRLKDKIIVLEEKLNLKFKFDEPVIENLRYYFKGGHLENVSAGTGAKIDLKLALTGTLLHSVGQYYGLSGITVRQFLDKVFRYDGAALVDHSAEADTEGGAPFDALVDVDDILYLGKNTRFKEVYADLAVNGSYTGLTWEYWDGDEWKALAVAGAGANLAADGPITFIPPADWARTAVNGQNLYWIRVKFTAVTTAATVNCFRQNSHPERRLGSGPRPGGRGRAASGPDRAFGHREDRGRGRSEGQLHLRHLGAGALPHRRGLLRGGLGPPGGAPRRGPGPPVRRGGPQVSAQTQRGHRSRRQEVAGGAHDAGGPGRQRQHPGGPLRLLRELRERRLRGER